MWYFSRQVLVQSDSDGIYNVTAETSVGAFYEVSFGSDLHGIMDIDFLLSEDCHYIGRIEGFTFSNHT